MDIKFLIYGEQSIWMIPLIVLVQVASISSNQQYLLNTKNVSSVHEDSSSGRKFYLIKVRNPDRAKELDKDDYFKGIFNDDDNGNGNAADYSDSDSEGEMKPVNLFLNIFKTNKTIFMGKISIVEPR